MLKQVLIKKIAHASASASASAAAAAADDDVWWFSTNIADTNANEIEIHECDKVLFYK